MGKESATRYFDRYRKVFDSRPPDTTNVQFADELTIVSPEQGMKILTISPADGINIGNPPRDRSEIGDAKYLWVVAKEEVPYALESSGQSKGLSKGRLTHTNLTGGDDAHSAGEMWFISNSDVVINGGSSRYKPRSISELEAVAQSIKASGYRVAHMGYDDQTGRFVRCLRGIPVWI